MSRRPAGRSSSGSSRPKAKKPEERDLKVLGALSPGEHESRDRYTLTHLHAKGGMGRVWLARDGALGRQIALKDLRPDQADNSILCSRFLYEAKITASSNTLESCRSTRWVKGKCPITRCGS